MHINHVISLKSATKRREHITKEFGKQDIQFQFYDAITPSENLNNLIQQYLPNLSKANLSEGEKACFMSHYMLWKKCIEEDLPYIYIFEDDILLGENANLFLNEDKWLNEVFHAMPDFILRFETLLNYSKYKDVHLPEIANRKIMKLVVNNHGTGGYVISQSAIIKLMDFIQKIPSNKLPAIDLIMFNLFNQCTYQMVPALCVQDSQLNAGNANFSSQLNQERTQLHKHKKTRSFKELLLSACRKPKKIAFKLYLKFFKERHIVPFK